MSLRAGWENLSPNAKRAAALGGGLLVVVAITAGSLLIAPPTTRDPYAQSPRDTLVRNILTDADPRQLGMEAMVNRLERMEKRMGELHQKLERDAKPGPGAPASTQAPSAAEREQALGHAVELEALRQEIGQLRDTLTRAQAQQATSKAPSEPPGVLASPKTAPAPADSVAEARRPAPMEELFGPPAPGRTMPALVSGAASGSQPAARNLQIRTVAAPEPLASGTKEGSARPEEGSFYMPAGAMLKGVLLNGLDMPTGQGARKDPTPALIRVKHQAILPNRVRADVRECFLLVSGFGDLASERAYLRGETFSCVRTDGGVIEIPIDGYAVGEDGKVGVRGRVVSKQGALLAKALQAGFLQSFSQLFNRMPAIPVNTGNGTNAQFQSMLTPQAMGAAAAQGVGGSMDRLANYYLDMAEQMFPVIEVDSGRGVEFILNKGASLRLAR